MRRPLPLLIAALLGAPACYVGETTVHHPFSPDAVAALNPGTTTAQEVANLLGAPAKVVELGTGSAWLYEHAVNKDAAVWLLLIALRGSDTQSDRIWVFFDAQGILTQAAASFEAADAEYSMPPFS